jgi:Dolichyl-phosphate-mannose-protein mannosyltransferase
VHRPERNRLAALIAATAALTAGRLVAASQVGFGDSEALYASYAIHPQPAYLDHPGLVGAIARVIGGGTAPEPRTAHLVTTALVALVPWEMVLACRACGATWARSLAAGLLVAFVPEVAVGLFALTPDLPLAMAWIGALGLAARGLRTPRGGGATALFAAGALAGVAAASKASGALLLAALAAAYASRAAAPRTPDRATAPGTPGRTAAPRTPGRTAAPWAGLAAGVLLVLPVAVFEARSGWPMLRHRMVESQADAGVSLRNAGALVAGQLVYLSPLTAVAAATAARGLWRERRDDAVSALLWVSAAIPAAALVPLCLWSRVAEPHWIAPALLALVPAAARSPRPPSRRLIAGATAVGAAMVAAVYVWVLVPATLRVAPASYDPRLDLANELYGWPEVVRAARAAARDGATATPPRGADSSADSADSNNPVAVVAPHWVLCAQLEAGLRGEVPVGCDTGVPDDFDRWLPRARWREARAIVWVSDARFGPPPPFPSREVSEQRDVVIRRGGRAVRHFTLATFVERP